MLRIIAVMAQLAKALFPGSFDPLTNGHHDMIVRSLAIFDKLVIAILDNPGKSSLFSVAERVELIRQQYADLGKRVTVASFSGLLVDFTKQIKVRVIIRGLRAISDFDYEAQMALMNKKLSPETETFFLTSAEKYSYISSTLVRQIALLGGDISDLVPPLIERALKKKIKEGSQGK